MKVRTLAMVVFGLSGLGACGVATDTGSEPGGTAPAATKPATSSDFYATSSILARSAALVEGVVKKVEETYDERSGPRTIVTFEVSAVHAGQLAERQIQLRLFGGMTPSGKRFWTSISVDFALNARYVLFLRNDGWFYSPLATEALEITQIGGREVLVSRGYPLVGLRPEGLGFGSKQIAPDKFAPGDTAVADPSPDDLLAALTLEEFKALAREAIAVEGIAPSGRYTELPEERDGNWRVEPTGRTDGSSPTTRPGAVEPETEAPTTEAPMDEAPTSVDEAAPTTTVEQ
jgi:hypothetical protein